MDLQGNAKMTHIAQRGAESRLQEMERNFFAATHLSTPKPGCRCEVSVRGGLLLLTRT
jgi:hypothetical protein